MVPVPLKVGRGGENREKAHGVFPCIKLRRVCEAAQLASGPLGFWGLLLQRNASNIGAGDFFVKENGGCRGG
jgi:hypothetical protein